MIKDKLWEEIKTYCDINDIEDADDLVNKMLVRGFTIEKFGDTPTGQKKEPKVIEKEVIKEVEVEKIVEVIKEIEVEKIVKVSDDTKLGELLEEIETLKKTHKEDVELFKDNLKRQTQQIMKLNKEKDIIKEEYEVKLKEFEDNNTKNEETDIYNEGEQKRGFFGSNISNMKWPKKKK